VAQEGAIEPGLARLFGEEVIQGVAELEGLGLAPVILTSAKARLTLSRIARRVRPQTLILAMSELPANGNVTFHKVLCNRQAAG
jgi:flagellar biosynthesis component FlhA